MCMLCVPQKEMFEWFLVIIIAKVRFNIHLFTFGVAIYSSSPDKKMNLQLKLFSAWSRNFENGCKCLNKNL